MRSSKIIFSQIFIGHLGYCLIISLLGVFLFANHLDNPFQFDSVGYIVNNPNLQNPSALLTLNFWFNEFFSRALLRMSLALNTHLDGFNPFGYHLFNLGLHILNALLLYFVLGKAFRYLSRNLETWENQKISFVSFFVAVIFLSHPIQTESVIYIISRSEVMASSFYLSAFLIFQYFLEQRSPSLKQIFIYFTALFLLALLGFSVKQIVATLPAMMVLYYFLGCPDNSPALLFVQKWKYVFAGFVLVGSSLLLYKLLNNESFLIGPTQADELVGRANYMLSQPSVIVFYYLKNLFLPLSLNIDPDIEVITSLTSWKFLIPSFSIILGLLSAFKFIQNRIIFFFLCWFIIILSPSSSIVTLHDLAAEHRVYLASTGIFVLLALGVVSITEQCGKNRVFASRLALFLFVFIFGFLTIQRNVTWQSELSLWQDTYEKSPNKLRPLINLARAHSLEGNTDKAMQFYKESLVKGPHVFATNYNLADLYFSRGLLVEALQHFLLASQISPEIPESFAKLGEIYLLQNKFKLADLYLRRAVEINPQFAPVFKNLGVVNFYHLNNQKQGLAYFSRSLNLEPNQPEAGKIRQLLAQFSIR